MQGEATLLGSCSHLGLVDEAQVLKDGNCSALKVQCVHVQAGRAKLQEAAAHVSAHLNAIRLHRLVIVLDLLQLLADLCWDGCLAEGSHPLETTICHDWHNACAHSSKVSGLYIRLQHQAKHKLSCTMHWSDKRNEQQLAL